MQTAPLFSSQLGLYAECVNHIGEIFYNIPYYFTPDRELDCDRLCRAIEDTVQAHPFLFMHVGFDENGEPIQVLEDDRTFSITVEDIESIESVIDTLTVPFDLYKDRLFQIRLLRDAGNLYLYFNTSHHLRRYKFLYEAG